MSIAQNLAAIRKNLAGKQVTILGVTKSQTLEAVQEASAAGLMDFGNNYAQEGETVRTRIAARWHFIGHIQSRKVKFLVHYDCVQSLDRLSLAEDLNARLMTAGRTIDALVEINIGEETSKSGIVPSDLDAFVKQMGAYSHIRCRGLMVMPPPLQPVEKRRPFFARARALFDKYNAAGWDTLSMGTSEDYLLAVEEGSTLVRLGTVLFGPRA